MRSRRSLLRLTILALAILAVAILLVPWGQTAEPPRRVVMVSIDGLMPDYYLRADELGLQIPRLRGLMREGIYGRVQGVLPSVTYPSHTTLITGVPPRLHGIDANTVFDPLQRSNEAWQWFASGIRMPTLVSAARAASLTTAAISWPVSVGIGSDWLLPEFWRPGSEHEIDLELLAQLSTPGLIDAVARQRGRPFPYPLTEAERVDTAVHVITAHRPVLTLLHIFELDSAQHRHGPMSAEAKAAVERSDANLGRVLDALQQAGIWQGTLFAVVSDHGFLPVAQTLKPNVLLRQAGLIEVDAKGKVTAWRAFFHASGGSAALRLHDPADEPALLQVRRLFEARLKERASGLRDVLGRERIQALGGPADAALVLDAREGFSISGDVKGVWLSPATSKGTHGHVPDRDEMHAALVLAGPAVERRGRLGLMPMTAIAPTLARHLGVALSPDAGEPIVIRP